ncbi:MAG: efflux RND transporter permease subunit, partial [Xanthobacteraceae bacterium]|nr:efflux RND transporter permease subunit [Xanthobacteraceae bacterium]
MLAGLVDFALKQRLITLLAALALSAWGVYSYLKLPVDAFPDVAPVQVMVS